MKRRRGPSLTQRVFVWFLLATGFVLILGFVVVGALTNWWGFPIPVVGVLSVAFAQMLANRWDIPYSLDGGLRLPALVSNWRPQKRVVFSSRSKRPDSLVEGGCRKLPPSFLGRW